MYGRCLKNPIPEFSLAAELLSRAADALIAEDLQQCATLLVQADLRALREFAYEVAGPISPAIHRQSANPKFVPVPREARPRMPSKRAQLKIIARDGYRCRFCESRVIVKADISLQGIGGHLLAADAAKCVNHVPGLMCKGCVWTVPQ
jgi:hypothetical protein